MLIKGLIIVLSSALGLPPPMSLCFVSVYLFAGWFL